MPLRVTVTTSPAAAPVTEPVTIRACACSALLITSSSDTVLMVSCGTVVSTSTSRSAEAGLPALSETAALMV